MEIEMRILVSAAVLMGLGGMGAGCDPGPAASPAPKSALRKVQSNGGTYTVSFASTPDPIPLNAPFDLTFSVAPNAPGAPGASGLDVEVDARMPAHFHGMNRLPKLTRKSDGSFAAEGLLFHMPGHWELYFDVSQGGKTERAQVDVDLK
jgi:hypothetical protein